MFTRTPSLRFWLLVAMITSAKLAFAASFVDGWNWCSNLLVGSVGANRR